MGFIYDGIHDFIMAEGAEKMTVLTDENVANSIWDFFRNSQEDFELMMQEIYQYKDDMPLQIQTILFPILGNIFHHMSQVALQNDGLENEDKIPLLDALEQTQLKILSDPNFEKSINQIMPAFMANQMFKGGF